MEALRGFVATHIPFLQKRIGELDEKQVCLLAACDHVPDPQLTGSGEPQSDACPALLSRSAG